MSVYKFVCKCGSKLMIVGKTRPVCRGCGKQMRLGGKVGGPIMYAHISEFNHRSGKGGTA